MTEHECSPDCLEPSSGCPFTIPQGRNDPAEAELELRGYAEHLAADRVRKGFYDDDDLALLGITRDDAEGAYRLRSARQVVSYMKSLPPAQQADFATQVLACLWTDPEATLGGVVAAGSRCACGVNEAVTVLNSPRWGAWDVCQPCGAEQQAVLLGTDMAMMTRPDLIQREALRCIQLDRMLRA